jgi:transposase InsO family protein
MIALEDRQRTAQWIDEARREGSRLGPACEVSCIDTRTLQRWKAGVGLDRGDGRPHVIRKTPSHALSAEERAQIRQIANELRFAELPPARIVPTLADEGTYIASESSFSRILRAHGQTRHRGRSKEPQRRAPTTHVATAPRQLWCWDLTFLASRVIGRWYYLYLILDVYSRKIVGFEVHDTDSSDHAVDLLKRTALAEGIHALARKPVCHGDNGATVKATTVLAMMNWLGLTASYSRPRVSDDNAYVESLFRTAKYRPQYPSSGFVDLEAARQWASNFVAWYNNEHLHSGIRYVSPAERHAGHDRQILARRHALYLEARAKNPLRWSRHTRNWKPIESVTLNPEKDSVVKAATECRNKTDLAA